MFSSSCDTMVVMGDVTSDGSIIFGKNSDREPNEPLSIRYIPSSENNNCKKVQLTYIEIDDIENKNSCILFSPGNMYGAEMGFNCHGLIIGNEALFTRIPSYNNSLTGMDLVRLVLERCSNSFDGKNLIIYLLNKYGQGGNCGFNHKFYYHNSFLLVDSNEGWIIETIGKDYAAKRIRNGIYTISNKISFGNISTFDEYSMNLIDQAILNGWCKSIQDFHFEKCYSSFTYYPKELYNGFIKTYFSSSKKRQLTSFNFIQNKYGYFNIKDMFHLLRHHHHHQQNPLNGFINNDICMHASFGPIKINQTTGSLVSIIPKDKNKLSTHFITCSSNPCLSIFKPIWLNSNDHPPYFIINDYNYFSLNYSSNHIWWKYEIINRNIILFYNKIINLIQFDRSSLEDYFILKSNQLSFKYISNKKRNSFTYFAFKKVNQLNSKWLFYSYNLSLKYFNELSIFQLFILEKWRRSSQIPFHLLNYYHFNYYQLILPLLFLLLFFLFIYFLKLIY